MKYMRMTAGLMQQG